jgi:hypothetical protein
VLNKVNNFCFNSNNVFLSLDSSSEMMEVDVVLEMCEDWDWDVGGLLCLLCLLCLLLLCFMVDYDL